MKYALVTGGSRGIGRAISLKLAAMNYHVLINYRSNKPEAENTLKLIEAEGGKGELICFNVADPKEIGQVLGKWIDESQHTIEVLVNNAGINKDNLLLWMKAEEWSTIIDTNLNSFFYVTRLILKDMLANKYGRIINIVSLSGLKGMPGQVNYSAAKAGVIGATKALAQEVGKRKVTVNAVAPGFIKTDMTKDLPEKELKKLIPLNRFGEAEEVAEVVGFLASKASSYITGETISVNGGLYS
ncbi:3-oxoacyl-ACP reductase FabG [bacterium]|nr:3-oxoacyl-ACP reductase FabG [bacterium]